MMVVTRVIDFCGFRKHIDPSHFLCNDWIYIFITKNHKYFRYHTDVLQIMNCMSVVHQCSTYPARLTTNVFGVMDTPVSKYWRAPIPSYAWATQETTANKCIFLTFCTKKLYHAPILITPVQPKYFQKLQTCVLITSRKYIYTCIS